MSLYARVAGVSTRATPDGPRRAECWDCLAEMVAKTGNVVVHHWAHLVRPPDCQAAHEGEWHLWWKSQALDGTQEVAHPSGKRRADVMAPGGYAVEFQASPLTAEEVEDRESDWDNKLVWIFDAREAFKKGSLKVMGVGKQRGLFWFKAPERIKAACCPTYYDLGNGFLIHVGELRQEKTSLKGRGRYVSVLDVIKDVLCGSASPVAPDIAEISYTIRKLDIPAATSVKINPYSTGDKQCLYYRYVVHPHYQNMGDMVQFMFTIDGQIIKLAVPPWVSCVSSDDITPMSYVAPASGFVHRIFWSEQDRCLCHRDFPGFVIKPCPQFIDKGLQ